MTPLQSSKPSGITGGGFSCWYFVTAGREPCPHRRKSGGLDSYTKHKPSLLLLYSSRDIDEKVHPTNFEMEIAKTSNPRGTLRTKVMNMFSRFVSSSNRKTSLLGG